MFQKEIAIGNRIIGQGKPVYMIAEMSANHAGSIERAKEIIYAAKESGADCIKIQTYTPDTLTIDCSNKYFMVKNGTWEGENLYQLYGKAYTPWEWQAELKEEADKIGIDFLSTPFDKTAVDFLEEMNVTSYKIASFEMVDIPLIKYIASKGKPIIMSTGMGNVEEIKEACDAVASMGNTSLALLKCSSAYPADPKQMNLSTIPDMARRFKLPVGLSDHSMGHSSAITAVSLGACIIEKHFCISREIENPDASFSMTPSEYKEMVKAVRDVEDSIGTPTYGVSKQEESSMVFRRSIFAVKDIAKGETLTEDNIRIIRPGYGIKPKYFEDILGAKIDVDIERGTPISFEQFEKGTILFATNSDNTEPLYDWLCKNEKSVFKISNKITKEIVEQMQPSWIISYNYRHIIGKDVLGLMPNRVINLHTSLLPYNRGSSPNFFSFYEGSPKGVSIHFMDEGLDTGDILVQKELYFDVKEETFATSYNILQNEIVSLFKENWKDIKAEKIAAKRQTDEGSYHRMKDLESIREQYDFSWDEKIADVLARFNCNKEN